MQLFEFSDNTLQIHSIKFDDFGRLYVSAREFDDLKGLPTDEIEERSVELLRLSVDETLTGSDVREWMRLICDWSGRSKVHIWHYIRDSSDDVLLNETNKACKAICGFHDKQVGERTEEDLDWALGGAIQAFDDLNGIGISYASKFTRFLAPEHSAVLDSYLSGLLHIDEDKQSYLNYSRGCRTIAKELNDLGVQRPNCVGGLWRAADVDLVLWRYVDELKVRKSTKRPRRNTVTVDPDSNTNESSKSRLDHTRRNILFPKAPMGKVEGSRCSEVVCQKCFGEVALELREQIRKWHKKGLSRGRDAVSFWDAIRTGFEQGKGGEPRKIDTQDLICEHSYGPFASEDVNLGQGCQNTSGLETSFWFAKNLRGVSNRNAWKPGVNLARNIAMQFCERKVNCEVQGVNWCETVLFKEAAIELEFAPRESVN